MANRYPADPRGASIPNMYSGATTWAQQQNEKHKEYLKQQQKLRLMAATSASQNVSADALIENLLGKKDTFRPKGVQNSAASTTAPMPMTAGAGFGSVAPMHAHYAMGMPVPVEPYPQTKVCVAPVPASLPTWLSPSSQTLPQLYRQIWKVVAQDKGLVDTKRIFPILLTSGLPTEILGFIWGMANCNATGQLTEQELYVVLALVALAQSGCTFNNLSILNLIPQAPIPKLVLANTEPQIAAPTQGKMRREELNLNPTTSSFVEDDGVDDFTDFQSAAPSSTAVGSLPNRDTLVDSLTVLPEVMVETPSVHKFTTNSTGRSIGSRLANHSLGTPKPSKIRHHKHHHHHYHRSQQPDDDFTDFQQAREVTHSMNEAFPKAKTFLLKESAIRSEVEPVVTKSEEEKKPSQETKPDGSKDLMLVEEDKYSALRNLCLTEPATDESPASDEFGDFLSADDSFADIASRGTTGNTFKPNEEPFVDLASETAVTDVSKPSGVDDLFADLASRTTASEVCKPSDDLFASLGAVGNVSKPSNSFADLASQGAAGDVPKPNAADDSFVDLASRGDICKPTTVDDLFADLASRGDVFKPSDDSFADLASRGATGDVWKPKVADEPHPAEFAVDDWGSFEEAPQGVDTKQAAKSDTDDLWDLKIQDKQESFEPSADNSEGFDGFLGKVYSTGDMKPDDDNDDFGEFVGPETWPEQKNGACVTGLYADTQSVSSLELPPLALSRHGSVPSLDLKIFPSSTERGGGSGGGQPWDMSPQGIDHQLSEWQRCLRSCLTLLQATVNIFGNVSKEEVVEEVVGCSEGKNYLQNLLEVCGVCRRVEWSYKQMGSSAENKEIDSLLADIYSAWTFLESLYVKADIPIGPNFGEPADGSSRDAATSCGLCLTDVTAGKADKSTMNTSQLEYGGHVYHSACANLWVNCVDSSLPALASGGSAFF